MEDEKFTLLDENGIEREAEILNIITVDENDYILYSFDTGNDNIGICVAKIVYSEDGEENLIDIEDEEERKKVEQVVNELFDKLEEE